jgi:hypothetical protein
MEGSAVTEAGLTELVLYYPLIVMRCAGLFRKTARGEDGVPRHKTDAEKWVDSDIGKFGMELDF